ncbi:cation:dicarboxylate symporter family transporter [Shigella flexneri]
MGSIAKATGFSIFKFIRYIREELLIVLGTSSSESALPRMLDKMEKMAAVNRWWGLVIRQATGLTLMNIDIPTMAAVFIAQAMNSQMDIVHQITLLIVLLLSSKGAGGVTVVALSCWRRRSLRWPFAGSGSGAHPPVSTALCQKLVR